MSTRSVDSTYRLQLHAGFTMHDAADLVPYLRDLGVTHVYCSPVLAAAPGSTHGYDVVDPGRLDVDRGGEEGFAALQAAAASAGLGLVLDIVPNHVGLVLPANRWWWDVLRVGPGSRYSGHFDLSWEVGPTGRPRLVWPVLGNRFDEVFAAGEVVAEARDGRLVIAYHEHGLPVRPGTQADHGLADDPVAAVEALSASADLLRAVVDDQHWRLAHWRRANDELTHRRFFDVTTLGGVRVEDPAVFDDVHERVLALVADGAVDGLRIDHPDGLWDPTGYLRDLRAAAPDVWIVIEKILEGEERPRPDWPVAGTVGYAFLNDVLGLFIDPAATPALTALTEAVTGHAYDHRAIARLATREALGLFGAERGRLVALLLQVADEAGVEADDDRCRRVLDELLVAFPVYRTYIAPARDEITTADHEVLDRAIAAARPALPDEPLLDLVDDVMRLRRRGDAADELVHRIQQQTGPVMAKGLEDTTFYRDVRFVAANEVGGDPGHLGMSVDVFHAANTARNRHWPRAMLTTSTHDTKRSEDVRARLAVLTEVPDLWVRTVQRLEEVSADLRGAAGPSPAHRLLLWQTLVGAWPLGPDRLCDYLRKAAREAKESTNWLDPDERYEEDLVGFARAVLDDDRVTAVLQPLLDVVIPAGRINALSQTLLRLTAPGVPDTYQGTELWDLSLVDPDNRRPVDHDQRRELLAWLDASPSPTPAEILARMDEGVPKLHVVSRALRLRRAAAEAFGSDSAYAPCAAAGPRADHVVGFMRSADVLVVVPRRTVALGGAGGLPSWDGTSVSVPSGRWHEMCTGTEHRGGEVRLDDLLAAFPVALLRREADSGADTRGA